MHIFCITGVSANWFEVTETTDKQIKCRLSITAEFEAQMKESFGKHVVLYPASDFIQQLDRYVKENGLHINHGKVEYLDYSVNLLGRIHSFNKGTADFYFQKDIYFSEQEEYRFIFPTVLSEKAEVFKLGSNINFFPDVETINDLIDFDSELIISMK